MTECYSSVIEVVCMVLSLWYKATILNSTKHPPGTNLKYHPDGPFCSLCEHQCTCHHEKKRLFILSLHCNECCFSFPPHCFSSSPVCSLALMLPPSNWILKSMEKRSIYCRVAISLMLQMGPCSQSSYVFTLLQKLASNSQPRLSSITFQ